ncbi:34615_t:CDS:2, partial [Gigaspora margarita]
QSNEQASSTGSQDSSVGGTVRTRFGWFKLDDAPLESECASTSTNPSVAELMEVYTAKKRKDNTRKAVKAPNPPEEENAEAKNNEEPKRKAQVNGDLIILILDSRYLGYIVSASFLKKAGISIDRPSTIIIIGVHSEQKRPLGEIDQFPVTVRTKTITSKAVVTKAANYAIIVGNEKKLSNKEADEDDDDSGSEEEEETDSDDRSKDNEYEEENLLAQLYLYCETFNLEEISASQKEQMQELLNKYQDIFACKPAQLRRTTVVQYKIHIEEVPPIKQRYYSTSKLEHEFIGKEIERLKET